jgi:hypothetical protein
VSLVASADRICPLGDVRDEPRGCTAPVAWPGQARARRNSICILKRIFNARRVLASVELVQVVNAHPCGDHFKEQIIHAFHDGFGHKPETTFGTVNDDVLAPQFFGRCFNLTKRKPSTVA